jgi:allophanate hydrolase subunit 1
MSDLLNGHIQKRRVRCGKANCKCTKGEMHTAFYHVWHTDGRRYQKYIRRSQVEQIRAACLNYRNLQIQIRAGRAEYKQLFARARALIRAGIL